MRPARSLRSFFIRLFPSPAPVSRQRFGGKPQSRLTAGFVRTVDGPQSPGGAQSAFPRSQLDFSFAPGTRNWRRSCSSPSQAR